MVIQSTGSADGRLHIGVTPWLDDWSGPAESLTRQAEIAERLGFHSFWLPESHFTGRSAHPAPLLRLAAVAARTTRLRLATTSHLLPVRHPLHVAAEVACLDRLSNGRVILGVGRGFRRALFKAFGVSPREKRDRFGLALEAVLAAWRGDPVAWEDPPLEGGPAAPVRLAPLPLQKPHPPVWVAAFGPKAVSQAARLGLPYLASPIEPIQRLEENYALHREVMTTSGRDPSPAVPVMRTLFASRSPTEIARVRAAWVQRAAALAGAAAESLRGAAAAGVDDTAIVGEPAAVAEGIQRYRERLGLTHLVVQTRVPGVEPRALVSSLTLLAELELR